ncbi:ty3-gypsy retrotransposon protein [Cucumis melo var. makuwa]|uniref:Ty3-gypsy retrotransposon protein n=1 Tax=Cucumis melo var. makuwa TaxID=1194695 RepID=A0A5D3DQI5_CUCMM|nr:ty3-gypsy retrotransposon protein [Cucumis melo var. makuwa]
MEKHQDEGKKRCPMLKERQEKVYPFPDSDLPDMLDQLLEKDMLDQLLEKQLIQLPECKRPTEMKRVNDPNYYKYYHRIVNHLVEKCFVLKELILKLALNKKIELDLDDVAQTNHVAEEGNVSKKKDKKELEKASTIEESEELPRSRQPITLKDLFPENFPMEIISCQTISTIEDDVFPSHPMEVTPKPEYFLSLGINDLLTLSRKVKDTIIKILKNDDV